MNIELIKQTAHKFDANRFYTLLFEKHPEVRTMFPEDMTKHIKLFGDTITSVIGKLDDFESLKPELQKLGQRHTRIYNVKEGHYTVVAAVLLESLGLETQEQKDAWTSAYWAIAACMIGQEPS